MNLCSYFVSIIIGFVILPKNMTVPAGTDIKLIVLMLLIMLLTVFVLQFIPALLFSSHGISGCRFPLNLPPNLAYQLQMCYEN